MQSLSKPTMNHVLEERNFCLFFVLFSSFCKLLTESATTSKHKHKKKRKRERERQIWSLTEHGRNSRRKPKMKTCSNKVMYQYTRGLQGDKAWTNVNLMKSTANSGQRCHLEVTNICMGFKPVVLVCYVV